jgi:hypothetical protein
MLLEINNGSDNLLLNAFLSPTLGCTAGTFSAPCITCATGSSAAMALNVRVLLSSRSLADRSRKFNHNSMSQLEALLWFHCKPFVPVEKLILTLVGTMISQ